ncbi:phospho-N-acetylmuramoyl-pentapeptide-transferase homolog [Nymphaea colorata]|nr:phospho-N-acetylmuramoyl-pentapeptide-transferase homolog [Nymphaea colorata]
MMQSTSCSACGAWPRSFAAALSRRQSRSLGASIALSSHSVDSQIYRVTCCSYRSRRRGYGGVLNLRSVSRVAATDEDGSSFSLFDDVFDDHDDGTLGGSLCLMSSSEGEDSDTEIIINTSGDVDYHRNNASDVSGSYLETSRLANLRIRTKHKRTYLGILNNLGLIIFLVGILFLFDVCAWRIVRLPLAPFFLTGPFLVAACLASFAGFFCVPLFHVLKIHQVLRVEGPDIHLYKKGTATMGGLFFIPVGIIVAGAASDFSSIEVFGAAAATIAFAAIGLLDDSLILMKKHNYGLPAPIKIILEVAAGTSFSFWLNSTNVASPYSMKFLLPLPAPLGLLCIGRLYLLLATFCFVSMANGVNLTDGLDGLAGGVAALTFVGMSIAVLPICPDLSVFGASMSGACIGFLMHNRYEASIFMGDTGSLALGGALAAMASCTGMFFPLIISSVVFIAEVLSVLIQLGFYRLTKRFYGAGRKLFRMAPVHHHFELSGFKEPSIVATAYVVSGIFALVAGYVGLISA